MSFFCRLSGRHYWCTPHRSDNRLVQVCYECGAERPARELHDDFAYERFKNSRASAKAEIAKLTQPPPMEDLQTPSVSHEKIAVGQGRQRRFLLIK